MARYWNATAWPNENRPSYARGDRGNTPLRDSASAAQSENGGPDRSGCVPRDHRAGVTDPHAGWSQRAVQQGRAGIREVGQRVLGWARWPTSRGDPGAGRARSAEQLPEQRPAAGASADAVV